MNKIYEGVLHERIEWWCEAKGKLQDEQGGFRRRRGCVDQLFIFDAILRKRRHGSTFCCFIDIKKAFDTVWRDGLWKRLWDIGIRGKMWRVLRGIYKDPRC